MTKTKITHRLIAGITSGALGFVAVVAAVAGVSAFSAGPAAAQTLCSSYTAVRGDSLSKIAQKAGVSGGFQRLFDANRNVMRNPNLLEIGDVLQIPCADGSLPETAALRIATPAQPVPQVAVDRPVRFLTASGYAPFTEEDMPEGGFFTNMVKRAMALGNPDQDFRVIFVNDWSAHLTELLPVGAFDAGFPWFLPDCARVENLSESNAIRCTEFDASDPFYDALVGYYTLLGSPYATAQQHSDLIGARLCRPNGWFSFDLEAVNLVPPTTPLTFARSEEACWDLLRAGEVDVVTYDALPAQDDYTAMGMAGDVATIEPLATSETLHVFVPKTNPNGAETLAILNAGLEELRLSGEWFEIVRSGIQATISN
ncbi:LysM peptidoglycan-binding domain-containing protein [Yoonia sp.]|uniref:LysM peptidoglycan-binding domain-containing protein n=1 Tax=Yoonia sp. TaxID=2212373 RepID=UPI001A0B35AF|nr:LysM peptidoglycan-binding domain-containing protein [Yoonia sp.]MBE0412819.1 LysM peptidoglycan-binding domain-containing protein [Yoonia sp.]